jgi:hypothetical protein
MVYLEQQQQNNLNFFLHEFFQPAAESIRAITLIDPTSAEYFSFSILEAFLWLHLGVKLGYFSKPASRRVSYEFGNRLLGAYERTVAALMLQKFSPPLQRILEAELTGRVDLFSSSEEIPESLDEIQQAFQNAVLLVSGFVNEANAQQFLKMVNIAKPMDWEATFGKQGFGLHSPNEPTDTMWSRIGLSKVVEFMEAYRQMQGDYDNLPTKLAPQISLLKRNLKEIQSWRLNFAEESARSRFMEVANDVARNMRKEVAETGQQLPADFEAKLVQSMYDLLTDWGAPFLAQGASG